MTTDVAWWFLDTRPGGDDATTHALSSDIRLLLTAADLLTGAEGLAAWSKDGPPAVLKMTCEPPDVVLRRLVTTVTPRDLPGGFAPLWGACAALWKQGKPAGLEQGLSHVADEDTQAAHTALKFCRDHGMGVPYMAPVAAERLLRYAVAASTYREAQKAAAMARDGQRTVLDGVV